MINILYLNRRIRSQPSRKAPMEAAMPKQTVLTSQGINCMVSKIAMPLDIDPPSSAENTSGNSVQPIHNQISMEVFVYHLGC